MPIRNGRGAGISETPRAVAGLREGIEDEGFVGKKRDGVLDAGAHAVQAGAGKLEFDIFARGRLRSVR